MSKMISVTAMAAVLTASVAATALAVSPDVAKSYASAMAKQAFAALRSGDDRMRKFSRLIIEGVDFVKISKAALGPVGRRINKAKLDHVAQLLAATVLNETAKRLGDAEITGFVIGAVRTMPNRDAQVKAVLEFADREALDMAWRIAKSGGDLKIVDIEVAGYSMRIHYQNMFDRRLRIGGIDGLIKSLHKKVEDTPGMAWLQEATLRQPAVDGPGTGVRRRGRRP